MQLIKLNDIPFRFRAISTSLLGEKCAQVSYWIALSPKNLTVIDNVQYHVHKLVN